jgi:hypothetical protein
MCGDCLRPLNECQHGGTDMSQESISWSELAELTHATQVERFNWCSCEDSGTLVYLDCPEKEDLNA